MIIQIQNIDSFVSVDKLIHYMYIYTLFTAHLLLVPDTYLSY